MTDTSPIGSSFDDFLLEEGIHEEVTRQATKAVLAWQLDQARTARRLTKKGMALKLGTSRSQIDRLLDPQNEHVTVHALRRAAALVGKKLRIELVDE
ncbi:MAG: XRE family transcriptional regulator [Alphaproteobacteria bacterium]|nr:XRE family transcriptional regulator [Alphaproteobacteria bacterium]MBF0333212.1 XRE family transcriptional regulator [Alphaproteobacteria bacterium]